MSSVLPGDKRQMACARLHMTETEFKRILEKKAASTGVFRSQHQLLLHMHFDQNLSQTKLAEHLHISSAAVAVSLKKLEKGGYIKRVMQPGDNRVNRLIITEKGNAIVVNSLEMFEKMYRVMFDGFSEEEMDQFNSFFERIHANLQEYKRKEI